MRKDWPARTIGALLAAEIAEKQARSIKSQLTPGALGANLPLAPLGKDGATCQVAHQALVATLPRRDRSSTTSSR